MPRRRRVVEYIDESSSEDDDYTSSSEEEPQHPRRGAAVAPAAAPRTVMPQIMGGTMCANGVGAPLPLGHPSAHALANMSAQFQPQGPGQLVPAVGQIGGPQRPEPTPFDDRDQTYSNITSSYPPTNEQPRPMSNLPVWQTPVLPFSRSADTSPYDVHRSPFKLFSATGHDQDSWRPKREQGPMFTPQPQNIYGQPAQAQVQRDRYQPSNELKHQKPFEPEWSLRTGGFHPTKRILPTHVPVLRQHLPTGPVSAPKVSSHPSGLFGENRGELGIVERHGTDTSCYYKVPFPTSAPVPAATKRACIVDRPTDRAVTSRPYGGGAHTATTATINRYEDVARPTLLEATEQETHTGAPRPPVAAGTAQFMDMARPTLLEATESQTVVTNAQGATQAPQTYLMDDARPTLKQATSDHEYTGGAGQGELVAPMNTQAARDETRLNEKLEVAMTLDRAPVMGSNLNVTGLNTDRLGYGDASTVRVRDDCHLNPHEAPKDERGQGMVRWIPQVTVNLNKASEEAWINCRNEDYVLTGLEQNPYAQPAWSTVQ